MTSLNITIHECELHFAQLYKQGNVVSQSQEMQFYHDALNIAACFAAATSIPVAQVKTMTVGYIKSKKPLVTRPHAIDVRI